MDLVNVRSKLFQKQRELNEIRANEMYGYMKVGKKLEKSQRNDQDRAVYKGYIEVTAPCEMC